MVKSNEQEKTVIFDYIISPSNFPSTIKIKP